MWSEWTFHEASIPLSYLLQLSSFICFFLVLYVHSCPSCSDCGSFCSSVGGATPQVCCHEDVTTAFRTVRTAWNLKKIKCTSVSEKVVKCYPWTQTENKCGYNHMHVGFFSFEHPTLELLYHFHLSSFPFTKCFQMWKDSEQWSETLCFWCLWTWRWEGPR